MNKKRINVKHIESDQDQQEIVVNCQKKHIRHQQACQEAPQHIERIFQDDQSSNKQISDEVTLTASLLSPYINPFLFQHISSEDQYSQNQIQPIVHLNSLNSIIENIIMNQGANQLLHQEQIKHIKNKIQRRFVDQSENNFSMRPSVLVVHGNPGIGKKTAILQAIEHAYQQHISLKIESSRSINLFIQKIGRKMLHKKGYGQLGIQNLALNLREGCQRKLIVIIDKMERILTFKSKNKVKQLFKLFQTKNDKGFLFLPIFITNNSKFAHKISSSQLLFKLKTQPITFQATTVQKFESIVKQKFVQLQQLKEQYHIQWQVKNSFIKYLSKRIYNQCQGNLKKCLRKLLKIVIKSINVKNGQNYLNNSLSQNKLIISSQSLLYLANINVENDKLVSPSPFLNLTNIQQHLKICLIAMFSYLKRTDGLTVQLQQIQQEVYWVCSSLQISKLKKNQIDYALKNLQHYGFIKKRNKISYSLLLSYDFINQSFQDDFLLKKFFGHPQTK